MNHYLLLLGLVAPSLAVYAGTDVVELDPKTFEKQVLKSDSVWIVEFYAPWCGHCQKLVPDYSKAAKALKGVVKVLSVLLNFLFLHFDVKVGAVNADEHRSLGGQYGVQGFPTIKIFGLNKNKPEDYNGGRDAKV